MVVEQGSPLVRSEFEVFHRGERALVGEIAAVAFVYVQERIRHLAYYLAGGEGYPRHAYRGDAGIPSYEHLRTQIAVVALPEPRYGTGEPEGEHRIFGVYVEFLVLAAVHRFVPAEAQLAVDLVLRHAPHRRTVGRKERNVAVGVIAPEIHPEEAVDVHRELMVVMRLQLLHHAWLYRMAAAHYGSENIAGSQVVGAAPQLVEVVFHVHFQLAHGLFPEHVLPSCAALPGLVAGAVRSVRHYAVGIAESLACAHAEVGPHSLEVVETDDLVVRSEPYLAYVVITVHQRVGKLVHAFVEGHVLDFAHHRIDILLLGRQRFRTYGLPEGIIPVMGFRVHIHKAVGVIHRASEFETRVGVGEVALAYERQHPRRVPHRHREVGIVAVAGVEPRGVGLAGVFGVYHQVAQPVDVGGVLHVGVDGAQGVVLGVDAHLAVERRGGYKCLGMVAYQVGLAPVHLHGIDDVVVVVEHAARLDGRREFQVEGVDEGLVEVDLEVEAAGELAEHVALGIDAGDAVGLHGFVVRCRVAAVAPFGYGFGQHDGQIRHSGHRRCVDVFEEEGEVFLDGPEAQQLLAGMCKVQLHLVVDVADVFRMAVGVVAVAVGVYVGEKPPGLAVVSLHPGSGELVVGDLQHEVALVEDAWGDLGGGGVVTQELSDEGDGRKVPCLKIIVAVQVGGDAYCGVLEIDACEGYALAGSVGDAAAHLGGLCRCKQRHGQQEEYGRQSFHRFANIPKTAEPEPLMEAYTAPSAYIFSFMAAIWGYDSNTPSSKSLITKPFHSSIGCCSSSFRPLPSPGCEACSCSFRDA